jgi:hypothetical protein
MRWDVLSAEPQKIELARALVSLSARRGWSSAVMAEAACNLCGDPEAWRRHFPHGPRDALWFISEMSDESMRIAFAQAPASSMAAVIDERLAQNRALKPFVRMVMAYDVRHPVQAIRRMQRTARVMEQCTGLRIGAARLTMLNHAYTAIVFFWLLDRSPLDRRTGALTRGLMRMLRL